MSISDELESANRAAQAFLERAHLAEAEVARLTERHQRANAARGELMARLNGAEAKLVVTEAERDGLRQRKDVAYSERNHVVIALAKCAAALGYRVGIAETSIEGWSEDWHGCIYIDLPTGQVSWHYHDSFAAMFACFPAYGEKWDGHNTVEKYRRVDALSVDDLRGKLAEAEAIKVAMLAACTEALQVVDDCYAATGHIKVFKTSEQRMRIESAALAAKGGTV